MYPFFNASEIRMQFLFILQCFMVFTDKEFLEK